MKKTCAKEALKYIKDKSIIGLGGGSTISYLVSFIKESKLDVKIVTPSSNTEKLCRENNLNVLDISSVSEVSVAFDGCDEIDYDLNALKSCGGIHTKEKIVGVIETSLFHDIATKAIVVGENRIKLIECEKGD